ncbi:MAG: hypothetical protein WDN01_07675 [Rhizomicrobium sp.]
MDRPILRAILATACGLGAFALLQAAGAGAQESLLGGTILAGALNILGLASLNRGGDAPTSGRAAGESWP